MNVLSCSSSVKPPNTNDSQKVTFVCPEIGRFISHNTTDLQRHRDHQRRGRVEDAECVIDGDKD